MIYLLYDHSFEGFLTAVFEVYEYKYNEVKIVKQDFYEPVMFSQTYQVITNTDKAQRVLKKLEKIIKTDGIRMLLFSFCSEDAQVEQFMYNAICYALQNPTQNVMTNYSHSSIMALSKFAKSVGREKHRMEAFVRFELLKDSIYFAKIAPDFDVLLLIKRHFENRYQDQKWIIYDIKRNYGLYYDLNEVEVVHLELENKNSLKNDTNILSETEINYQSLWKEYFDHTNIKERKNNKLHIQNVPKRYWKYLSEKQPK